MRLEDSSWKRFLARALVLGVLIFGAVRLAVADPGVARGAARSYVTVAGTLTGVTGTATARFRFYDAMTGGTLLCESSAMITGGAFSAEVPLGADGATGSRCATMFDGADVFVEVAVNGTTLGVRRPINPVPYAHYASQYGTPDCPVGYTRTTEGTTDPNQWYCRNRAGDDVVRVGNGPSAFWIDRYEAIVSTSPIGALDPNSRMLFTAENDFNAAQFPRNGQWRRTPGTQPPAYALSVAGMRYTPARYITWFQAQEACRASGKRLPTGEEWLTAANGTVDPGVNDGTAAGNTACNTRV